MKRLLLASATVILVALVTGTADAQTPTMATTLGLVEGYQTGPVQMVKTVVWHGHPALGPGENAATWDVGDLKRLLMSTISGFAFWDLDLNGVWDGDEPGRGGVRVVVADGAGQIVFETTTVSAPGTPAHGSWRLVGTLEPGTYTIYEVLTGAWFQTCPETPDGVYRLEVRDDGRVDVVTPPSGFDGAFDFGNAQPMGFMWHDVDGDGRQGAGERLMSGWEVIVEGNRGALVTRTRAALPLAGYWFLDRPLPAGIYRVYEQPQGGWEQTYPRGVDATYEIRLDANGNWEIVSPAPPRYDGLLRFGNALVAQQPSVCPDCPEWVVFHSDRAGRNVDVYRMRFDGSAVARLTDALGRDVSPVWGFGGSRIAFASTRDGDWEIYRMRADGSDEVNVTRHPLAGDGVSPSNDMAPSWSCEWIAFQSDRDGNWEIYKTDPDGTTQVRLTDHLASDVAPAWSPDDSQIAFQSDRDGYWDIYVMDADGTNVRRITSDVATDRNPTWSPDGLWVAFESERNGNLDVFKVDVHSGQVVQLTSGPAAEGNPAWMPYCEYIFFESDGTAESDVYRMEYDGSGQTNLIVGDVGPDYWHDGLGLGSNSGYVPLKPTTLHFPFVATLG